MVNKIFSELAQTRRSAHQRGMAPQTKLAALVKASESDFTSVLHVLVQGFVTVLARKAVMRPVVERLQIDLMMFGPLVVVAARTRTALIATKTCW